MRTRIKICGITGVDDALAAVRCGVDAIGLVFYAPSLRYVSIAQALDIAHALPPLVNVVGLFVNAEPAWVREVLASVPLHVLQFHGDESPEYCAQFQHPFIKALRMTATIDLLQCAQDFRTARALLLDADAGSAFGGSGQTFDWARVPASLAPHIILAGGLNATNVGVAIKRVRPYAVDVSGGVESAKGVKSAALMADFVRAVVWADGREGE